MGCYKNNKGKYSIKFAYVDIFGETKYIHRYTGKNGFTRKKDAQAKERELKEQLCNTTEQLSDKLTVKNAIDEMLIDSKTYMKTSSLDASKSSLKYAKKIYNMKLKDIDPRQIRFILNEMDEQGLAVRTIDKFYFNLNKTFEFCVREGYMNINPMHRVKRIRHPDEILEEKPIWKLEDFNKFIGNVVDDHLSYTFFNLLFFTGMRKGEAQALQWKDIDFKNKTIDISKTISTSTNKGQYMVTPPKTKNSIRRIGIPNALIPILKSWYDEQSKFYCFDEDIWVFGYDKPIPRNTIGTRFRNYCLFNKDGLGWCNEDILHGNLEIGNEVLCNGIVYCKEDMSDKGRYIRTSVIITDVIKDTSNITYIVTMPFPYIVMHDLRHSCVSMMINKFKTQKSVVAMANHFGHTIETMLTKYSHMYDESETELIREFNEILDNEGSQIKNKNF